MTRLTSWRVRPFSILERSLRSDRSSLIPIISSPRAPPIGFGTQREIPQGAFAGRREPGSDTLAGPYARSEAVTGGPGGTRPMRSLLWLLGASILFFRPG